MKTDSLSEGEKEKECTLSKDSKLHSPETENFCFVREVKELFASAWNVEVMFWSDI